MSDGPKSEEVTISLRHVSGALLRFARVRVRLIALTGESRSRASVDTTRDGLAGKDQTVLVAKDGHDDWRRGALDGATWALTQDSRAWSLVVTEIEGLPGETGEGDIYAASAMAALKAMGVTPTGRMFLATHARAEERNASYGEHANFTGSDFRFLEKSLGASNEMKAGDVRVVPIITVGRIVHYMSLGSADGEYPPETQAALVTGINADGTPSLVVFSRTGSHNVQSVPYAEAPSRGHWSWPPRG